MTERLRHNSRAAGTRVVAGALLAVLATACAEKGFTPPQAKFSPKIALQVSVTADQQAGFGPRWLVVVAGFDGSKDNNSSGNNNGGNGGGFLGYKIVPYVPGTQTITISVDLSKCFAYYAALGRSSCPLLVGAALRSDTLIFDDTTNSGGDRLFMNTFDDVIVGPTEISPGGRAPVIPPLDLSATRYGVVRWEGESVLSLGGNLAPTNIFGSLAGAANGAGTPTLFALTQGVDVATVQTNPPQPQFAYPQLAIFQNGTWKRITATVAPATNVANTSNSAFTDLTALSATEVYMGHRGGVYKFDGSAITKVAAMSDSVISLASVVTAAQAKYVIAGSGLGAVWIGNLQTGAWTRTNAPTTQRIESVCITGPNEAFAATFNGGGLFRFDGTAWTSVPALSSASKFSLQCPGPGQAFVMASGSSLFKWNGSGGWTAIPTTGLTIPARQINWGVVSSSEIYAYGDSANVDRAFYKFNGTSWQELGRTRFTSQNLPLALSRMWANPAGGAAYFAGSLGRVDRVTPSGVGAVSYQPSFRDVIMTSTSSAFVVGANLFLGRFDGTKWNVDAPPPATPTNRTLNGVWSDKSSNAWAAGTQSTILRYDGTGWSVVSEQLKPVATPDSAYNAVWGIGSDVWIAGSSSMVHCKSPTSCNAESTGGSGALYSVWGTSAANVFAVGLGGRIIRYNGTSWTSMASPTGRALFRVAGSGPNDVWAAGDSVMLHFDGTSWITHSPLDDLRSALTNYSGTGLSQNIFQIGLWVRGPKEVYVGGNGNGVVRWNGSEWRSMDNWPRRHMVGISGAASGCGIAVTEALTDSPQVPTLWRGVGSTGCFLSPMAAPTSWP